MEKISLLFLIPLVFFTPLNAFGHKVVTHQHIAAEAIYVWSDAPQELKDHIREHLIGTYEELGIGCFLEGECTSAKYDPGDEIVVGSAEEDEALITDRRNGELVPSYSEHLWNPDLLTPEGEFDVGATFSSPLIATFACLTYGGAFKRAEGLYALAKILYHTGDKDQAYYWLGRVAHLLTDVAVPAHVHNDLHLGFAWWFLVNNCQGPAAEDDAYEDFMGVDENIAAFIRGVGAGLAGKEYRPWEDADGALPNIRKDFPWTRITDNPTPLFKLFWYTAQKTQYFASDGDIFDTRFARGDGGRYTRHDRTRGSFSPSLWNGELRGQQIITDPGRIERGGIDNPPILRRIATGLIPHTLKAVAGLYRLFWLETHGPTIASLTATPSSVPVNGQSTISVEASDPDGDALTYTWSATCGTLSSTTGEEDKIWTAPETPGTCTVTVVVTDPPGASDTKRVDIEVTVPTQRGPFAYITNFGDDTVSVIDTAINKVIASIPVGSGPVGIAVHPAGTFAYVANYAFSTQGTVSVIDASTLSVTDTVTVGRWPIGVAVHPDGTWVYVANQTSLSTPGTVSVIEATTNKVIATIPVGVGPVAVAVHPAGTFAYVTNQNSHTISVIDTATNTIISTVPVESGPVSAVVHPNGAFLYVTCVSTDIVSVIDVAKSTIDPQHAVVAIVPVADDPEHVAVHPHGTFIYVTHNIGSDTISVIDTSTLQMVTTVPVGRQPQGVAVHPAGTFVYVANRKSNNVSVIDAATLDVFPPISVGMEPLSYGQFVGPIK